MHLSRRSFIAFGASVSFIGQSGRAWSQEAVQNPALSPWVTLKQDGTTIIQFALAEMGQGTMTSLPMLLAEEMDADWARVQVVQSPCDGAIFGIKGALKTFGSTATITNYQRFRLIGAQIRRVLITAAAAKLSVPADELTTLPGQVIHEKTGRHVAYGDLAGSLQVSENLPAVLLADLKPPEKFRYIGKMPDRIDIPGKVNGSAMYGIDTRLPNMAYGAVIRPEVQGETPVSIDETGLGTMPGIHKILLLPSGLGIIGASVEAIFAARDAIKITWSQQAKARNFSSARASAAFQAQADNPQQPAIVMVTQADAQAALAGAAIRIEATYCADHAAHFCMEPMNATCLVAPDKMELWVGSQAPTSIQAVLTKMSGLKLENVVIHSTLLGGGFGRRFEVDFAVDAYLLAKSIPGQPVKLLFTREDDVRKDPYRPLVAQSVSVGLNADGSIAAWHQRCAGESYFARTAPTFFAKLNGADPLTAGIGEIAYPTSARLMEYIRQDTGIAVGALRGTDAGYTNFTTESVIDEIAARLKLNPLAYRLALLQHKPRACTVLNRAAQMADWHRTRPDRGLGIAYSGDLGAHLALVAEISVDAKTGDIKLHHIWCAFDGGQLIQPLNVRAQLEGGLIFGLGLALFEQLNIENGAAVESNFGAYRVARMSDIPTIDIELIESHEPPAGVGEAGIPAIAPAISNAFAACTGKRLRHLPMLPERVKAALAS